MSAPTGTTLPSADGVWSEAAPDDAVGHLRRLRWAVRATLTLGVAASVAANVLHARPNPISQIIAAWPPLALLLTVELISRVPHHRRSLGTIRIVATSVIAAIATWVSYWHLVGVAARYGETEAAAAYLLPLSVDGLVIVASVSLVELTGRIRASTHKRRRASVSPARRVSACAAPPGTQSPRQPSPATLGAPVISRPSADHRTDNTCRARGIDAQSAVTADRGSAASNASDNREASRVLEDGRHDGSTSAGKPLQTTNVPVDEQAADAPCREPDDSARQEAGDDGNGGDDRVPTKTAAAVAYWYQRDPDLHPAEIAARINRSERTVRRHWPPTRHDTTSSVNGHQASRIADSGRRR